MDMPDDVKGVNLEGLNALFERHPEVTITTKYGNWIVLHAAHILAVAQSEQIHPALAEIGEEIHTLLDEAMDDHSTPSLADVDSLPWDSPVTVTISTIVLVQCAMSLAGVHMNANQRGVDVDFSGGPYVPEGTAEELIAQADASFLALLVDVDPEFPVVIESLYEER